MRMRQYCACCEADISKEQWESGLYNPKGDGFLLCKYCGKYEDEQIEKEGTNDLPWLLKQYRN